MQTLAFDPPARTPVHAHGEPDGARGEHDVGFGRVRDDLVDVRVDVDGRHPARPRVDRAGDATHVDVRVEPPGEVLGDRTHGRRAAPRREPALPALHRFERLEGREGAVVADEPEQVGLLRAREHPVRRVGTRQARSNASLRATSDHVPSASRRTIERPSAIAHAWPSPTASAVTALGPNDGSVAALSSVSSSIPAPVPTISPIVIEVAARLGVHPLGDRADRSHVVPSSRSARSATRRRGAEGRSRGRSARGCRRSSPPR